MCWTYEPSFTFFPSLMFISTYILLVILCTWFINLRQNSHASAGESLEDALKQLYLIDAIDENGTITHIGRTMAGTKFVWNFIS